MNHMNGIHMPLLNVCPLSEFFYLPDIGRFAVMSMSTYIKAGEVHVEGDEEIRLKELKANQRQMNGHISILIKVFGIGKDWRQKQSISESMIGLSLSACPLWLLY